MYVCMYVHILKNTVLWQGGVRKMLSIHARSFQIPQGRRKDNKMNWSGEQTDRDRQRDRETNK